MPLTHVKLFKDGKWSSISIEQARAMHPNGRIPFKSGLLICDLCNQPVMMTQANIVDSYFRHSSHEADKNCPERTFGSDYLRNYYTTVQPEKRGLPIRIKISDTGNYHFEMGFPFVNELHINRQVNIQIVGDRWDTFNFKSDRLNPMTVTYLNIGNNIHQQYTIRVTADNKHLPISWPTQVLGFNDRGIFQKNNGLYIPKGSDIHVGYEYVAVLCTGWLSGLNNHVEVKQLTTNRRYRLYSVVPLDLSVETARFFLQEFQCRLAEAPAQVIEIWPEVIQAPFLMYHKKDILFTYMTGDANPQLFPAGKSGVSSQKIDDDLLLRIKCVYRQQLMAVGRAAKILDYKYYWNSDLDTEKVYKPPIHSVIGEADDNPEYIQNGVLSFTPAYDGKVTVEKNGWIITQYSVKSGEYFQLPETDKNCIYRIYQGLDCIWESVTNQQENDDDTDNWKIKDAKLLSKLKKCKGINVKPTYAIKTICAEMKQYPLSKLWISRAINQGVIPIDASALLMKMFKR